MKNTLLLLSLLFPLFSESLTLQGHNYEGGTCTLTIEEILFENDIQDLLHVRMQVRSHWQLPQNASLEVKASPSPWVLYGRNKDTYDQLAITLTHGSLQTQDIVSYMFQTWDSERGLLQKACRF